MTLSKIIGNLSAALSTSDCSLNEFLELLLTHKNDIKGSIDIFNQLALLQVNDSQTTEKDVMRKLSCLGYCFHESRDSWLSEQLPSCPELVRSNQIDVLRVGKILSRVQMLIQQCCRPDILVKALATNKLIIVS